MRRRRPPLWQWARDWERLLLRCVTGAYAWTFNAPRVIVRRFDVARRPHGLTNGQFSLLTALNRPQLPRIGEIASLLGVDRTTLTANLKPLERRGLDEVIADSGDRRGRRVRLRGSGRDALVSALPVWRKTHNDIDKLLGEETAGRVRADLRTLV